MPKYFFHVLDGVDDPDLEGTEFDDDHTAKAQAVVLSGEILKDLADQFWKDGADWNLIVTSDDGREVCQLKFSATSPEPFSPKQPRTLAPPR